MRRDDHGVAAIGRHAFVRLIRAACLTGFEPLGDENLDEIPVIDEGRLWQRRLVGADQDVTGRREHLWFASVHRRGLANHAPLLENTIQLAVLG